jgi:hypothetical protein
VNYAALMTGPLSVFGAGVAGALVRVVIAPPANRRAALAHVVSGSLIAVFVAPAIVEHWLHGDSMAMQRAVALAVGIAGPFIADIAVKLIQRRGEGMANRLADRVAGKENDE